MCQDQIYDWNSMFGVYAVAKEQEMTVVYEMKVFPQLLMQPFYHKP